MCKLFAENSGRFIRTVGKLPTGLFVIQMCIQCVYSILDRSPKDCGTLGSISDHSRKKTIDVSIASTLDEHHNIEIKEPLIS